MHCLVCPGQFSSVCKDGNFGKPGGQCCVLTHLCCVYRLNNFPLLLSIHFSFEGLRIKYFHLFESGETEMRESQWLEWGRKSWLAQDCEAQSSVLRPCNHSPVQQ